MDAYLKSFAKMAEVARDHLSAGKNALLLAGLKDQDLLLIATTTNQNRTLQLMDGRAYRKDPIAKDLKGFLEFPTQKKTVIIQYATLLNSENLNFIRRLLDDQDRAIHKLDFNFILLARSDDLAEFEEKSPELYYRLFVVNALRL